MTNNKIRIVDDERRDKMTEIDLKAYTSRAVELEAAIYTQKKLMTAYDNAVKRDYPVAPKMHVPTAPTKPNESDFVKPYQKTPLLTGICVVVVLIALLMLITAIKFDEMTIGYFLWIILGIAAAAFLIIDIVGRVNHTKVMQQQEEVYSQAMKQYTNNAARYTAEVNQAQENYKRALQAYGDKTNQYILASKAIMQQHKATLIGLENALQELYNANVIFPKYREMVAISAINEYLLSGRCSELEGQAGAYNLYEMELRQNIIIGQLSNIISNLEQIRNNQYTLYQELVKANDTVNGILHSVRGVEENTRLTAYFAEVNAIIAAAPRITIGHTF